MKKKIIAPKINNYEELIDNLKRRNISPQDAWDIVYRVKVRLDPKTVWKLDKFYAYILERLHALHDVYPQAIADKKISKLYGDEHLIALKKILPKRVETIRKVVSSDLFLAGFKFYNGNKKFDKRKEIENLEKLIAEKRQDEWWHPAWIDAIGESWGKTDNENKSIKFDKPGFRQLLKILR